MLLADAKKEVLADASAALHVCAADAATAESRPLKCSNISHTVVGIGLITPTVL